MPRFEITVTRTATRTKSFVVEAETIEQAKATAIEQAPDEYFEANERDAEYDVTSALLLN